MRDGCFRKQALVLVSRPFNTGELEPICSSVLLFLSAGGLSQVGGFGTILFPVFCFYFWLNFGVKAVRVSVTRVLFEKTMEFYFLGSVSSPKLMHLLPK
jgi:hypothetical protein